MERTIEQFFDMDMIFIIALFAYMGLNDVNLVVSISVDDESQQSSALRYH